MGLIFKLYGISLVYYESILIWSPSDNKKTMSNSNMLSHMWKQAFFCFLIEISHNAQQNRLHNQTGEGSSMVGKHRSLQNDHS